MARSLSVAVAALAALPAAAVETRYYEWQEPNGTVVFSAVPPGPGVERYSIRYVDTPAHDHAPTASPAPVPYDGGRAVAQHALDRALRARTIGRAPLPGERLHDVNGDSQLAPWYYTRQRQLDLAVAQAETDLRSANQRQAETLG